MKLDIIKIGDATAVVLPEELRARLGLEAGGQIEAGVLADGGVRLGAEPASDEVRRITADLIVEYREVLEALAR